jgi:hypothetical protein
VGFATSLQKRKRRRLESLPTVENRNGGRFGNSDSEKQKWGKICMDLGFDLYDARLIWGKNSERE